MGNGGLNDLRSFGVIRIRSSNPRSVWIMVHQRNRWIHSGHGFAGFFDAPWSRQILDQWSGSGSPQRNAAFVARHLEPTIHSEPQSRRQSRQSSNARLLDFESVQRAPLGLVLFSRVSQKTWKLLGPESFSGLFSGDFLGSRKAFLKAPENSPDSHPSFTGCFLGFVAWAW